jgi:DNA-binding transcriptional regulator YdaS (Cro superfamily)
MTLADYLRGSGATQGDFAARLDLSPSDVCEIAGGPKTPGLRLAVRIERATGGAVSATSLARLAEAPEAAP